MELLDRIEDQLASTGLPLFAIMPSLAPFVLMPGNIGVALRMSIIVSFGMLFAAGWGFGHYSRMNPWKTGLALMAAGGILGLLAILLEK